MSTELLSASIAEQQNTLAASLRPSVGELIIARRDLHAKALVIGALFCTSYWPLVVADTGMIVKVFSALVMIIALVATATCVFHDGNHRSFSTSTAVNRLAGFTGDLLGGSSWIWRYKHNNLHHGNTNVAGIDGDIDQSPFARLTSTQPWRPRHRYQHLYMWFLYGFMTLRWLLIGDFLDLKHHGIGLHRFPRQPRRRDVALLFGGKALHIGWAIALPLVFHRWWVVLLFYFSISWVVGLILSTMFQLAHCVELANFPQADSKRRGSDFTAHQFATTFDVHCRTKTGARMQHWLMGGLDYQIEHHLAPRLPHTIYPLVARRLDQACAEQGLEPRYHTTPWQAVRSHQRWLKQMGKQPTTTTATGGQLL